MLDRRESSCGESSSSGFSISESGFARFFGAAFAGAFVVFSVVCFVALGLGAAFFAGALGAAFAFYSVVSMCIVTFN